MTGNAYIWSKTPANNSTADGSINWQEDQLPPSINNSARGMMAASANMRDDQGGQLSLAGGTTAYTLTTNSVITALADGVMLSAKVNATNTGASTLAVDGLTAKSIRKGVDTAVAAGDLLIGAHLLLQYNSTLNAAAGGWQIIANSGGQVSSGKLPRSYLSGLAISNGTDVTNDINIAVGECRDSTNSVDIVLGTVLTKQLDAAWAVGTAAGGLDTGSIANDWYHVYLIKRLDTNVVDAVFSASATSPTLPANYTHFRRIASFIRTAAAIKPFLQNGDEMLWVTPVEEISTAVLTTTPVSTALGLVPDGLIVDALGQGAFSNASTAFLYIYAPGTGKITNSVIAHNQVGGVSTDIGQVRIRVDTSAQITYEATNASSTFVWVTTGYVDRRGRDG